jgi:hypothetical protein
VKLNPADIAWLIGWSAAIVITAIICFTVVRYNKN